MGQPPSFSDVLAEAKARVERLDLTALERLGVWQPIDQYYLVGTYPPLKAMIPLETNDFLSQCTSNINAYFHIPFCEQRCTFCHFAKEILPADKRVAAYLEVLAHEVEMTAAKAGNPAANTIYFGGGTPSYLNPDQIADVFTLVGRNIGVTAATETTFELHPSVIDAPDYEDRLDALVEAGVNRWVFGIQSMDDRVLRKLNRGHTKDDALTLLKLLRERNLDNLSVDLIFGLPYQTHENWYGSMMELINAGVTKFNIFPLMFKQADPISAHYRREPAIFPDNRQRLVMHFMTEVVMESQGFRRGPVFYYAKDEHHSLQQESKYDGVEEVNLLPFGVSGFGYVGTTQYYNHCTIDEYAQSVARHGTATWMGWELDLSERQRRAVMFPLRSGGVDRRRYADVYGVDPADHFEDELAPFVDQGLLHVTPEEITLTDAGAPFADSIAITLSSSDVRSRVRQSNRRRTNLKLDVIDRHDYSPLERATVGSEGEGLTAHRGDQH